MKKTFCDGCGDEVLSINEGRYLSGELNVKGYTFSIASTLDEKEDIDICKYCVIRSVRKLDERPVAEEAEKGSK